MAYSQLGYPYSTTPQFLMSSSSLASCLEPPTSAHSVPVYRSPRHEHPAAITAGLYSGAIPKGQGYYTACSSDATAALYARGPLESKDGTTSAHMGTTSQTPTYYPYDYAFGQYPYDRYGYSCSDGAARRKNATRETTSTLKAWLQEHQKNPYPTKGEKIMLAIITRMTLTQVSTWFANARRRLKKENKVTWSPRACKSSDDRPCDDDSDGAEEPTKPLSDLHSDLEDFDLLESDGSDCEPKPQFLPEDDAANVTSADISHHGHLTCDQGTLHRKERLSPGCPELTPVQHPASAFCPGLDLQSAEIKPKIWSIAHTAVSLDAGLQAEFPPCMLSAGPSSPAVYPSEVDRQQDSPVATLREWVDGVFHNPLFQHRSLQAQALPKPATAWRGLNSAAVDSRTPGHSFEHVRPTSAL